MSSVKTAVPHTLSPSDGNSKNQVILLLGPAGSGKTTVARALAGPGVTLIETGNLLEAEIRRNSELGAIVKPYKTAGELVPSDLVKRVISAELERSPGRWVLFDGFPRSNDQVGTLHELIRGHNCEMAAIVIFTLSLAESIQRLSGRRLCSECGTLYHLEANPPRQPGRCDRCAGKLVQRGDDREELVRHRFETFQRETMPIIQMFRDDYPNLILDQSASPGPVEVLTSVRQRLKELGVTIRHG